MAAVGKDGCGCGSIIMIAMSLQGLTVIVRSGGCGRTSWAVNAEWRGMRKM